MHPQACNELRDASLAGGGRKFRVREAAEYLRLSVSTLNKLRMTGAGPQFFKVVASIIYSGADLDQWLAAHRRSSTAEGR
jgi:hypothetical protein